jgi:hypothetical protein
MATEHPVVTELVPDTSKRSRGRRYRTDQDRAEILNRFDRSGLTQRAFAEAEGIKYPTLVSWLMKRRVASASTPAVRFEEVQLAPSLPLEVKLPCGTLLRGVQADALALLVRLVRS